MAPITDWGTAVMTSLAAALAMFLAAIPKVIGFALVLIIGWFIAGLIGSAVAGLLRMIKFNELANRSGLSGFVNKMGVQTDSAGLLADLAKWFVRLIVLVVAFDTLGLPAVSNVLQQLLLWLPNLVVGLVVLVIGGLLANAAADLVRGATGEAGFGNSNLLATLAKAAIWAFAIVVAVNQIGVASTLVNTLFMGFVGMLALAGGLAFGLGGRDTAGQIVASWYNKSREAAPKMQQAADAAQRRTQQMGPGTNNGEQVQSPPERRNY